MKFAKFMVAAAAMAMATAVFADASERLVSFYSNPTDRYADGEAVLDGEWYALCWTANADFGGVTYDCKPAVEGDRILRAAGLAKNGCCPLSVFHVASTDMPTGGKLVVCLLDTRSADKKSVDQTKGAFPAYVNGATEATEYAVSTSGQVKEGSATAITEGWDPTAVEVTSTAKITDIAVKGEDVAITVSGMMKGIKYNLLVGPNMEDISTYAFEVPKTTDDDPTFHFTKKEAEFFKVVREPLKR